MAIKMTMADGTIIEGTAEELAELQRLANNESEDVEQAESKPKYKTEKRAAKVGERILITDAVDDEPYGNGDVFTVTGEYGEESGDVKVAELGRWVAHFEYEVIVEEESEQAKPKFSVGDYAKVIGETFFGDIDEGTYVKVTEDVTDFGGEFRIDLIDESDYDTAKPEALEKVELTDEDLTFLKIGREPGEFKDGDIVEITGNTNYSSNEVGDIGVVEYISSSSPPLVNVSGRNQGRGWNHTVKSDIKLIAPVESRVDGVQGDA